MASTALLNSDAWIEVLSRLSSLQDLRSAILSSRQILDAFYERRKALTSQVFIAEIAASSEKDVYKHVENLAARKKSKSIDDNVLLQECVEPLLASTKGHPKYYKWCLGLCRLYSIGGRDYDAKREALLNRVYQVILSIYEPDYGRPTASADQYHHLRIIPIDRSRLSKNCYLVAQKLADTYASRGQLRDQLSVEQEILRRSKLKEIDSIEWGNRVVKTFRVMQDAGEAMAVDEAKEFGRRMYELCRERGCSDRSLFWARHLVTEYMRAGQTSEAIAEQQRVLSHIIPGSNEAIAWARQLIVMYTRAGQVEEALSLKAAVWATMSVSNSSYYGWARELAEQYRRKRQPEDALRIVLQMHEQSHQMLSRRPNDSIIKYHATQAALALVEEYKSMKRMDDAAVVR